jgi:hypothetical protein
MRGDWIHDWVQVEMDYRAGPPPAPAVRAARAARRRPPSRPWKVLWAALFPPRPVEAPPS